MGVAAPHGGRFAVVDCANQDGTGRDGSHGVARPFCAWPFCPGFGQAPRPGPAIDVAAGDSDAAAPFAGESTSKLFSSIDCQ